MPHTKNLMLNGAKFIGYAIPDRAGRIFVSALSIIANDANQTRMS